MEFHDLGKHCSSEDCKQQDFLPFKCNACNGIFCLQHRSHSAHACTMVGVLDKRVPECPLCNKALKVAPGIDINVVVNRHIASGCTEGVRRRKSTKHRCSARGCRGSEFVKVTCPTCHLNYCFKHRHEEDHQCHTRRGKATQERAEAWAGKNAMVAAGAAALARHSGGGGCRVEEALAAAGQGSSGMERQKKPTDTARGVTVVHAVG